MQQPLDWISIIIIGNLVDTAWSFVVFHPDSTSSASIGNQQRCIVRRSSTSSDWSITDDWNELSRENPQNAAASSEGALYQDWVWKALVESSSRIEVDESPEDAWIRHAIEGIVIPDDDGDDATTSKKSPSPSKEWTLDEDRMSREIAMLVRCDEQPEEILRQQGRAMPQISPEQKMDPTQLVCLTADDKENGYGEKVATWSMTPFFRNAVSEVFRQHAISMNGNTNNNDHSDHDSQVVMDRSATASWMSRALQERVGLHEERISSTISLHGTYGKGYLTLENFQNLYLKAVVGASTIATTRDPWKTLTTRRERMIRGVWRDLENHGIPSPNEVQHLQRLNDFQTKMMNILERVRNNNEEEDSSFLVMDECEITDDAFRRHDANAKEPASHERVLVTGTDDETSVWLADGDFVFIDEETCIGCMQCVTAAPTSFRMIENGRARTYLQRLGDDVSAAVASCPVNCMHHVSFRELKQLELARDGDALHGRVRPLHVARRDSDANHPTSWYHSLKAKCQSSGNCPQQGCYDCPSYSQPGQNPFFQDRLRQATHERAQHFIATGEASAYRKTADL